MVHGYSWLEVVYTKRESAPVPVVEERVTIQSFFFKKQIAQPKEPELPKEAAISCELERLKGEFTLEPGVYSLRHLKWVTRTHASTHLVKATFQLVRRSANLMQRCDAFLQAPEDGNPVATHHRECSLVSM